MPYFVYVIRSEQTGRLYKGMTENLESRLAAHNARKVRSTKAYVPWVLVHQEEYKTEDEARRRELFLKSGYGREFLKRQGID